MHGSMTGSHCPKSPCMQTAQGPAQSLPRPSAHAQAPWAGLRWWGLFRFLGGWAVPSQGLAEELKVFTQEKVREELKKEDLARDIARLRSGHESSVSRGKIQADVLAKLRKKLEETIMQEISKSAWDLMYGETEVAQQIDQKVHETCHLLFGAHGPEAKESTQ
ncbi:uncharacterized protein LOC142355172 [Convolutriloba macropyga]|uniref:uncharacterized protein LOC142355172 n=1 Tax=Convolutriloba macropyga TaxID=536237 RepID=UPI003F51E562